MSHLRYAEPRYTRCKCGNVKPVDSICYACQHRLRKAVDLLDREFRAQHIPSQEKSYILRLAEQMKHNKEALIELIIEVNQWTESKLRKGAYESA